MNTTTMVLSTVDSAIGIGFLPLWILAIYILPIIALWLVKKWIIK